ncbi:hypothetical protein SAY87_028131 [Trapa incisa]|uniref:Rubisco accumulation factor 1.1, chloroplastic n=1 Tax=Trapa incisa TaxID=236973 RepID=A0AAN7KTG1_9MYRT|nr:hypothetical protein SAY87_028131 [Trapa incisa]
MLSLAKPLSSPFLSPNLPLRPSFRPSSLRPSSTRSISAIIQPSGLIPRSPGGPSDRNPQLYQPFHPPPSPIPSKYRSLDTAARLDVLINRLGLWYEYAPLISSFLQEGFTPSTLEEITGITGVDQNCLIVGAQVRDSLIQSGTSPDIISAFELGGAELLYEIRLLSASQRSAAAEFIITNSFDAKQANELARAMKDFPRRRGEKGWEQFDYNLPGDCLSFMYYRQSREHMNSPDQRAEALEQALSMAATEKARTAVLEEIEGGKSGKDGKGEEVEGVRVPIVRMKIGEVAEASSVVVLPVCRATNGETEVVEAPWECKGEGEFGVVAAEKEWQRWVVLPGWEPVAKLGGRGGVAVTFPDSRILPWKVNRWYQEEAILVVVDRRERAVEADDGFYLVAVGAGSSSWPEGLRVERGSRLKEAGVTESLGALVLVVRPPKDEVDDQLSDEDWE